MRKNFTFNFCFLCFGLRRVRKHFIIVPNKFLFFFSSPSTEKKELQWKFIYELCSMVFVNNFSFTWIEAKRKWRNKRREVKKANEPNVEQSCFHHQLCFIFSLVSPQDTLLAYCWHCISLTLYLPASWLFQTILLFFNDETFCFLAVQMDTSLQESE